MGNQLGQFIVGRMTSSVLADVNDSRRDVPCGGPVIAHDVKGVRSPEIFEWECLQERVGSALGADFVLGRGQDLQAGARAASSEGQREGQDDRGSPTRHPAALPMWREMTIKRSESSVESLLHGERGDPTARRPSMRVLPARPIRGHYARRDTQK